MQARYRKTALIEATQWFKPGDHPAVSVYDDIRAGKKGTPWISTLEGGHVVSPGDWIATGVQGEHWPIKPDVFAATYELDTGAPDPALAAAQAEVARLTSLAREIQAAAALGKAMSVDDGEAFGMIEDRICAALEPRP